MKHSLAALAFLTYVLPVMSADAPRVPYPDGYRDWRHIKSMVIQPGHPLHDSFGGIHHLYANKKGVAGYKTGKFPEGSVIVFDLLQAPLADHAITEGQRKVIGVMYKNTRMFAATGGWGYEGFEAGNKGKRLVGINAATACHACHTARVDHDHVFSAARD